MASPELSLKGRALRLLAGREYSRQALQRKLLPHAPSEDALEQVLDALTAAGLLSEVRFVASVVHRQAPRFGVARIRRDLQTQGIDAEDCAEALADLRQTEAVRAQAVWQRKFGALPTDAREMGRQARFLMGRGFSAEVVFRLLRSTETLGVSDAVDDEV
ncbi:recombination regulator RecX [Leptothrix ochracea]